MGNAQEKAAEEEAIDRARAPQPAVEQQQQSESDRCEQRSTVASAATDEVKTDLITVNSEPEAEAKAVDTAEAVMPPQQKAVPQSDLHKKAIDKFANLFETTQLSQQAKRERMQMEIEATIREAIAAKNVEIGKLVARIKELEKAQDSTKKAATYEISVTNKFEQRNGTKRAPALSRQFSKEQIVSALQQSAGNPPTETKQVQLQATWETVLKKSVAQVEKLATPNTAVEFIQALIRDQIPTFTIISRLKATLMQCEKDWLLEFIDLGGVGAIVHACRVFEQNASGKFNISQVVCQCQLILCFKALMKSALGIETIIERDRKSIREMCSLIRTSRNLMMRMIVLNLFSAIALFSVEGHALILDAVVAAAGCGGSGSLKFLFLVAWINENSDFQSTCWKNAWHCVPASQN
eukprot:TRINITY_DN294_c0_g1_i3.p1 TRINITY_DN294_c0_g1~~TRINITY_DN294_c0_g1_i3.p1  ORF type:complete len:409 (-),score=125.67 TRINITY_DN294_c0_g1_i3:1069-2295(-)